VDDNEDLREYLSKALEFGGAHRVFACETVSQALEALEAERFDLLISDLELPDGSGHQLMQALARHGGPPAIALSGHGSAEDVDLSLAAGFSAHLTKPVTLPQLKAAIHQVCGPHAPVG
jgi:CheY-like chemotaxis protein